MILASRTALLSAITFLNENGLKLLYETDPKTNVTLASMLVNECAEGKVTKEQIMDWFDVRVVTFKF